MNKDTKEIIFAVLVLIGFGILMFAAFVGVVYVSTIAITEIIEAIKA